MFSQMRKKCDSLEALKPAHLGQSGGTSWATVRSPINLAWTLFEREFELGQWTCVGFLYAVVSNLEGARRHFANIAAVAASFRLQS